MGPWFVRNRLYDTLLSLHMKVGAQPSNDFRSASYYRPMVLLFPDEPTANDFSKHARSVRRSCVIMRNRRHSQDIHKNLSTNVSMVLVEMPENNQELFDMLTPCALDTYHDDQWMCLSIAAYSLFLYVNQYRINENKNMEIEGVVINPAMEITDRDLQTDIIMKYLEKMLYK